MKKQLSQKLNDWQKAGLLHEHQVKDIITYENGRSENQWVLSGLTLLGVVIIGIGMISVIAANWSEIPNAIKLAIDFLVLAGVAYAIYRTAKQNRPTAFNAWIVAMQFSVLASIGLISQIYHTGGKLYQAILLWAFAVAPISVIATKFFPPMLWMGSLLGALTWYIIDSGIYTSLFSRSVSYVTYSLTMLSLLTAVIVRLISGGDEWPLTRVARYWTAKIGVGALIVFEIFARGKTSEKFFPMYLGLTFLAIALGGIVLGGIYNRFQKLTMMTTLILFSLFAHISALGIEGPNRWLLPLVFVLSILISAGLFTASLGAKKTFQFILAAIGVRLLVVYFEAVGGLAATGFGLIISGLFVLGMGWLWRKYRLAIQVWVEEFAK